MRSKTMWFACVVLSICGCVEERPLQKPAITAIDQAFVVDETQAVETIQDKDDASHLNEDTIPSRRVEIDIDDKPETQSGRYQVTAYSAEWCVPCQADHKANGNGDGRVAIQWTDDPPPAGFPQQIPLYVWRDGADQLRYLNPPGSATLDRIVAAIERNDPPRRAMESRGMNGTIRGRAAVARVLDWWKTNIGSETASFEWDRTGAQTISLMAGGDWSPINLYGRSGEFRLVCKSQRLPLNAASIAYRLGTDGNVTITGQTVFPQTVLNLDRGPPNSTAAGAGVGPGTILTVLTVLHGVWQMLHPTVDLALGGNVSCSGSMEHDVLKVRFSQAPSIKVSAWLRFELRVDEIDIAADHVRVGFGGSRWFQEKLFAVVE